MTYEFKKPSKPLAHSYEPVDTFKRVSEKQLDPNKVLFRGPLREVLSVVAGPVCGATRDLSFLCRGDEQFEAVEDALQDVLTENNLLKEDDFKIKKTVTTPEKDGEPSYITGEVVLEIPEGRYTNKQIETIAANADKYAKDQNNQQARLEQ